MPLPPSRSGARAAPGEAGSEGKASSTGKASSGGWTIPFVDLRVQNDLVREEVEHRMAGVIDQGQFILGAEVARFEEELAAAWEVRHCVTLGSGTDAVEVALRASNIRPGDEVIVPSFTFAGSAAGIVRCGATPVFVDVRPDTLLIDPAAVAAAIGPHTAAVVAVHLYGQMADMASLGSICERHGIAIIEDAAQSHGASRDGLRTGPRTIATATSFYPTKNLGAWGDGGALLTNDDTVYASARSIRNYGSKGKYDHSRFGFNSRLDTLQAAVLRAKLPHLATWNSTRQEAAALYDALLGDAPAVQRPTVDPDANAVWHLYVIRVENRAACRAAMDRAGIGTGVHYPNPLHLLPMFQSRSGCTTRPRPWLPVAEQAAKCVLSLPLYPGISRDQQRRVIDVLTGAASLP